MPRIHPKDVLRVRSSPKAKALLPLLPVCQNAASARNELRWMKEHATSVSSRRGNKSPHLILSSYVKRRASGEPLQYILGSEYFGDLEIKCRPGVLIPRQETAASISHLVTVLHSQSALAPSQRVRVLDLCSGTGCIPLLFHHEFYTKTPNANALLELVGVDISGDALSLARENLILQLADQAKTYGPEATRLRSLHRTGFVQADVLSKEDNIPTDGPPSLMQALNRLAGDTGPKDFDILVSNPPYISPKSFRSTTSRSVRNFEPKLALVPPSSTFQGDTAIGDSFYPRLLQIAEHVRARFLLLEVADIDQAMRVASLVFATGSWEGVEIWRDSPSLSPEQAEKIDIDGKIVDVRGMGNGRSVFAHRGRS
ncbi:Release factor glutamine methyltransferase [Lecanosticta acicola]|uniref:Release factor glutamine methyltransferase n=1 Tax=Lecanosticta acicola TaxID=111012 RepID=A0AAI8YTJ1_9PEZI|nr:Release factor glutamine methyltransferase [Lecanosticta acicola]